MLLTNHTVIALIYKCDVSVYLCMFVTQYKDAKITLLSHWYINAMFVGVCVCVCMFVPNHY